jgi:hypothetical protein
MHEAVKVISLNGPKELKDRKTLEEEGGVEQ